MPANSFSGNRAIVVDVDDEALYAFDRKDTIAAVRRIPTGGTTLELPQAPGDGEFYDWTNEDNSCGAAMPVLLATTDGKPIQGAASPFALTTPGTAGRAVFLSRADAWALILGGGASSGGSVASAFVYRPGGVTAANVFASWAALYASLSLVAGPKLVQVDDSIVSPAVVPAGTYDLDGVTFTGVANIATPSGGAALEFAAGAVVQGSSPTAGLTISFEGALTVTFGGGAPLITCSGAAQEVNIFASEATNILTGGAGAFASCSNGFLYVSLLGVCVIGDSTHAVFACSGGTFVMQAVGGADVRTDAVDGAGGSATVFYDSNTPGAQLGTVTLTQFSSYTPLVPGDWSPTPTQVGPALDQLAARLSKPGPLTVQSLALSMPATDGPAAVAFDFGVYTGAKAGDAILVSGYVQIVSGVGAARQGIVTVENAPGGGGSILPSGTFVEASLFGIPTFITVVAFSGQFAAPADDPHIVITAVVVGGVDGDASIVANTGVATLQVA